MTRTRYRWHRGAAGALAVLVAWLIGCADTVKVQILCRASLVLRSPLEPKHRCAVTICHPISWGRPRLILCPSATGLMA
jgi:hypothetical protein